MVIYKTNDSIIIKKGYNHLKNNDIIEKMFKYYFNKLI